MTSKLLVKIQIKSEKRSASYDYEKCLNEKKGRIQWEEDSSFFELWKESCVDNVVSKNISYSNLKTHSYNS